MITWIKVTLRLWRAGFWSRSHFYTQLERTRKLLQALSPEQLAKLEMTDEEKKHWGINA